MHKTGNARIVMVASIMHILVRDLDMENLNSEKTWEPMLVYARTKLANILFTKELHRRLQDAGIRNITVNALHPGTVRTNLFHHSDEVWFFKMFNPIQMYFFKVNMQIMLLRIIQNCLLIVLVIISGHIHMLQRMLPKELRLQFMSPFQKSLLILAGNISRIVRYLVNRLDYIYSLTLQSTYSLSVYLEMSNNQ